MTSGPDTMEARVLDAAKVCCERWGLAKVTVDDIAAEAEISRATLYRLFPGGKDVLFEALRVQELEDFFNRLLEAIGSTDKPRHSEEPWCDADALTALKARREAYIPEDNSFRKVPVFDGHALHFGQRIEGPAIIEQVTTSVVLSGSFDAIVDRFGSFVLYRKGRDDLVACVLQAQHKELA